MHYTHRLTQARIHQIVGWFVLVPVLILGAVLFVIGKNENLFEEKYELGTIFSQGFGLKVGYPVVLRGIQIGRISKIEFTDDNQAKFTFQILKKYKEKIRTDSRASIGKQGGFFSEPQIEISPGSKSSAVMEAGAYVKADSPTDFAKLMAEAEPMLNTVKSTLDRVDQITKDIQATVKTGQGMLGQVQEATAGLPKMMADFTESASSIKRTSKTVSDEIPSLLASVHATMDQAKETVTAVKDATAGLPDIINTTKGITRDVQTLTHDSIPPLVDSVQGTMADVNEILAGAKKTFPISVFATRGRAAGSEQGTGQSGPRSLRSDDLVNE
jgi:phospholipid/cholesterol/gamma-HCH transport system substrate-binding protein